MARIRITKQFTFETAHALLNYDGLCRNIHGHSYTLFVTLCGEPEPDPGHSDCGMVMDFGKLKQIVREAIVDPLDHALLLNKNASSEEISVLEKFNKLYLLPYQPTCENLLADIAARLGSRLPERVTLHSLKLCETATSYAEWYADDNA